MEEMTDREIQSINGGTIPRKAIWENAKYAASAATYYDYQIAVGNLFQAQAEQLRARYEYIYRTKIMEFYSIGANLFYNLF